MLTISSHVMHAKLLVCMTLSFLSFSVQANNDYCTISCNGQINLSIGASGASPITPSMLIASTTCSGPYEVHVFDGNGIDIGNSVDCNYVGQTLMASVVDVSTGANCWSSILIEDKFKPEISCTDEIIPCNGDTSVVSIGIPVHSDNCGVASITYNDVVDDLECNDPLFVTIITRTWTVTDVNGNTQTCEQNISLQRGDINQVMFPPSVTLDCSSPITDISATGEPTLNGVPLSDFCNLKFTYTDGIPFPTCGGGFNLFRTFTIIDCCDNQVLTGDQLIKVEDTTPPMITCPADMTISTSNNSCTGALNLPMPTVSDDCSAFDITVDFDFPNNGNVYFDIPQGTHEVTFIATDSCGNTNNCSFFITVKDQVNPIAVCESSTVISIGIDGTAKVDASVFDQGSTDNCGIDTLMIRKMSDTDFSECLEFDCSEVGDTVMVVLRVEDSCGNYNECMVEAIIADKLPPAITCPPDTTLFCTSYQNFILDTPDFMDNCGLDSTYFQDDSTGFDLCTQTGVIIREWFAVDLGGLIDSCEQAITIIDTTTITFNYPADTMISCTDSTDPDFTGWATATGGCRSIAVSFEDVPVMVDECENKIFRTWRFYDNCADTFLLADSTQKIFIKDLDPPTITCVDTIEVDDILNVCQVFVFAEAMVADSCSGIDTIFNDSPFLINNLGFSASGFYPIGEHLVTYTAIDSCGNESTCQTRIIVNDVTNPDIFCTGTIIIQVFPNTPATFDLNNYLPNGFFGNDVCSNPVTLSLDTSSVDNFTVGCSDIDPPFLLDEVQVLFSDAAGNINTDCTPDIRWVCLAGVSMAGMIQTEDEENMEDVMVKITDPTNTMMNYSFDGLYTQENLSVGNDYTIIPEKNTNPHNGVTTYDLVMIRKHILGLQLLDSPYKIIAADANRSGTITALDIALLRSLILHNIAELPDNTSWRFVDAQHQFTNPLNPFQDDFAESLECLNLTESELDMNFIAVKVGDVNSTAIVNNLMSSDTRSFEGETFLSTENLFLEKNKTYSIPIFAEDLDEMQGFQFTLSVDPSNMEFLRIKDGCISEDNFGFKYLSEGAITCSWDRANQNEFDVKKPLFYLDFISKTNDFLENQLLLNSKYTAAEVYTLENKIFEINFQFQENGLDLTSNSDKLILFQNQPNPFSTSSEISFFIPQSTSVVLQITDISGKLIYTYHNQHSAGLHTIPVQRNLFPNTGIYFYKIITPQSSDTKKMLIVN